MEINELIDRLLTLQDEGIDKVYILKKDGCISELFHRENIISISYDLNDNNSVLLVPEYF